jgi:hypothetical protein
MIISPDMLGLLVLAATVMVAAVPVILLLFWIKDFKGGNLW